MASHTQPSPTIQPSPTSALDQFLSTPELVLCVLEQLSPYDLLSVSRADSHLRAIVQQSKPLLVHLATGPSRHFTDLPPHAWNFQNVELNTKDFPEWSYGHLPQSRVATMRVPEFGNPLMPLISMRVSNEDSNPRHSRLDEHLTLYLDWTSRPNMIFDSVRNKFIPPDRATRKLVLDRKDKHPTDPPLPTTVSVARINISQTPIYCTVSAAPHVVFSYHSASVEASVCPCTFGDMIMVAQVLLRTPPKGWNSNAASLEWRPREDHPEVASHDELDKVIDMIQVWPVVYNRVLCKPIPIDVGQCATAPP